MALARAGAGVDIRKALSKKVVGLYRRMCREVIAVKTMYIIDETPAEIRHMLLLQFKKNQQVTDPRIVDMLLTKGEMELEETRNQWKQRGHLMSLIKPDLDPADPIVDFEEHMRRLSDGTLEMSSLTRGYSRVEMQRAERQINAQLEAGSYKAPTRLPGASAASGSLPWSQDKLPAPEPALR